MKKFKISSVILFIILSASLIVCGLTGCDFVQYIENSENQNASEEVKLLQEEYVDRLYTVTSEIKFREHEQKLYEYAVQDAVNELYECLSETELQTVYEKHLIAIGKIKTDGQYADEEEAEALSAYRAAILKQAEANYDKQKYSEEQITYLDSVLAKFSGELFEIADTENMNALLQKFYFDIFKEDEILSLINLTDFSAYEDSQKQILIDTLAKCAEDIRGTDTQENVNEIKEVYKFEVYKRDTVKKLNEYTDVQIYRKEQADEIKAILSESLRLAENAQTNTQLDNIFREYQIAVYDIPTSDMLYSRELEELKTQLGSSLADTYKLSFYREKERQTVQELLKIFQDSLVNLHRKEDVLSEYIISKSKLDCVKTANEMASDERTLLIDELYGKLANYINSSIDENDRDEYLIRAESVYSAMCDRISTESIRLVYREFAKEIGITEVFKEELQEYKDNVYYRENEQNQVNAIKEEYLTKLIDSLSAEEKEVLLQEAKNSIDIIKSNDDLWNDSVARFRADLKSLYGEEILEEPRSLTEANDYNELAKIIDYYAFYQLSGTEFVCDTFRVKLNFDHGDATYERNEVYWHCELLKSAVDIQAKFDNDSKYIIFSLKGYNFASESNLETTKIEIKELNGTQFASDKTDFTAREEDFDSFSFYNYERRIKVSNSQQLWYALEHRYFPVCEKGSSAETVLNEAKKILRSIIMEGMSDEEKMFQIYSWLCKNIQYDDQHQNHNSSSDPDNYPNERVSLLKSYFIEGALFERLAVCIGFAKLQVLFLSMEGIEVKINIARMPYLTGKNTINSMTNGFHTYVFVKMGDVWYYSDTDKGYARGQSTYSINFIMLPKAESTLFDEHMNKELVGGTSKDYYKNFKVLNCKAYVFDKQELYNLLDNVRDNNFMLPFSVFAGYSGCVDDIINYGHDGSTSFNLLYNNKAELIIRKI